MKFRFPEWSRLRITACITALYLALFGFAPLAQQYRTYFALGDFALPAALASTLIAFAYAFALIFTLALWRKGFAFTFGLLCLLSAAGNIFVWRFHMPLTPAIVGVALEASGAEIRAYFPPPLILYMTLAVGFAYVAHRWLRIVRTSRKDYRAGLVLAVFTVGAVIGDDGGTGRQYLPFALLKNGYDYARQHVGKAPRVDISQAPLAWPHAPEDMVVVLVIGESSRPDHWSLNGYARRTNPLLSRRAHVISFPHTTSCTALTRSAVPCLMTRKTVAEAEKENILGSELRETSVISVLNKAGFDSTWIGVQGATSFMDSPFLDIAREAKNYLLLSPHAFSKSRLDEDALPFLDEFLQQPGRYKLAVVHTYGSHWPYTARYPSAYERFTPVCPASAGFHLSMVDEMRACDRVPGALVNSYDNSILYTDAVLDKVMARLENRNALVLYVSDHGQSLGEGGRYLHGNNSVPEQRQAAMVLWASDRFIARAPREWRHALQHRNQFVSHDYVFHSLLDCLGIRSDIVDPSFSLCR